MNNVSSSRKKLNLALKIIIPAVIILTVAGIWLVKNYSKNPEAATVIESDFSLIVTEKIDLEKLKSHGLPIIIDFGADSCAPCKEMAPVLRELNNDFQGKAIIKFADVWKNPDFAEEFPLRVIPTQIFFDSDGNPYVPDDPQAMQMILYQSRDTGNHVLTVHEGGLSKEMILSILNDMGMKE